jgi:hypothetical protein
VAANPAASATLSFGYIKGALRCLLHEPFCHFLALGLALFLVAQHLEHGADRFRIVIDPPRIQRIALLFEKQFGTPPTPQQMAALVDNYVREEIYFREGLALSLERDDEIVRRRIAQKYEFLQQDLNVKQPAATNDLRQFYEAHRERYTTPALRSFTQVFFSPDQVGVAAAQALAKNALVELAGRRLARSTDLGDSFPAPKDNTLLSQADIGRMFGGEAMAQAIFTAPLNEWVGPLRSGYGWHLIRVTDSMPPALTQFETVSDQVAMDYGNAARLEENARVYRELRAKYDISVEGRLGAAPASR